MAIQFEPVDVTSNTAYYVQVIDALRRKLDSGELQPGNQLPSEAELCAMFRVSRTVVRQALMKLENEGLVTKRKGKGSFITDHKINIALSHFKPAFSEDEEFPPESIENLTLSKQLVVATAQISQAMGVVKEGDVVVQVERLRRANNQPVMVRISYLPFPLGAPILEAENTRSLYHAIRVLCGVILDHGHSRFEAIPAPKRQAKLLNVKPGAPMLRVSTVNFSKDEKTAEYSIFYMPGDTTQVTANFVHFEQLRTTVLDQAGRRVTV
ncbi:MAG: GntR family transcriptional regulator [Anaerolineaceae bacterium]|jgi:GntR family transcriptional regulator|nr:GntR family transcriptional regulator [Anaerolineaceae bacterium]HNX46675.1 GntR family transcriptional regulator [Anaerolineaceae bacterium]HPT23254.1 GntR family transcriptional regulator [Anaerolineaceae bacterium]